MMTRLIHSPFRISLLALVAAIALPGTCLGQAEGKTESARREHPLKPALRIARTAHDKVKQLGGYQADLIKKEVVGRTAVTQKLRMKVRHKPFSVYLYFHEPARGREVIYVQGRNNGQLLAHETGIKSLVGTVRLAPTSATAMDGNKYPITKIGMEKMIGEIIKQWETESRYGETTVKYYNNAKIGKIACRVIESSHPQKRRQFPFKTTRLWIEKATGLPIRAEQFGFSTGKPLMLEQYTYLNVKTNLRMTDRDFDEKNPKYSF